jgi:hypothetical protein
MFYALPSPKSWKHIAKARGNEIHNMTASQCVVEVRKHFSTLYKFGSGYKFMIYKPQFKAWQESACFSDYQSAQCSRSRRMAEFGREMLGLPPIQWVGGNWTQYFKE